MILNLSEDAFFRCNSNNEPIHGSLNPDLDVVLFQSIPAFRK